MKTKPWLFVIALAITSLAQMTSAVAAISHAQIHSLKITILSTMVADRGFGEWGFSALVETDGHKILFDTGAHPNTVLDNAKALKIDLSDVEDVVLSHFHPDHTGGLLTLRRELVKTNPNAMSRVHVGAGIFLERRGLGTNKFLAAKGDYEATGGTFIVHDKPDEVIPGVWLTGPVPRVTPEKNFPKGLEIDVDGKWIEDTVPEDQSLVFNTAQGLVVLSGCGHAGEINTLLYARNFMDVKTVHAIVGGFHTSEASDETLAWTAKKLKEFGVAQILGAHCTGLETIYRWRALMNLTRKTCLIATTGAQFELGKDIVTGEIAR